MDEIAENLVALCLNFVIVRSKCLYISRLWILNGSKLKIEFFEMICAFTFAKEISFCEGTIMNKESNIRYQNR